MHKYVRLKLASLSYMITFTVFGLNSFFFFRLQEGMMLFCVSCDQGFHLSCHNPPLSFKPAGHWDCFRCQNQQGNNSFENGGMMTKFKL